MNRNPNKPHRFIEGNKLRTQQRIEQYHGIKALLETWELQPTEMQVKNHDYIIKLRVKERAIKNYILHRADPEADIQ